MTTKFSPVDQANLIGNSVPTINNNFLTLLTTSSGTSFPSNNLYVGRLCYRLDMKTLYVMTSTIPANWAELSKANIDTVTDFSIDVYANFNSLPDPYTRAANSLAVVKNGALLVNTGINDYTDGLISLTSGSPVVAGNSEVTWEIFVPESSDIYPNSAAVIAGDTLLFNEGGANEHSSTVQSVESNTRLTIPSPSATSFANISYRIIRRRWVSVSSSSKQVSTGTALPTNTDNLPDGAFFVLQNDVSTSTPKGIYRLTKDSTSGSATWNNVLEFVLNPATVRTTFKSGIGTTTLPVKNVVTDSSGNFKLAANPAITGSTVRSKFAGGLPTTSTASKNIVLNENGLVSSTNLLDISSSQVKAKFVENLPTTTTASKNIVLNSSGQASTIVNRGGGLTVWNAGAPPFKRLAPSSNAPYGLGEAVFNFANPIPIATTINRVFNFEGATGANNEFPVYWHVDLPKRVLENLGIRPLLNTADNRNNAAARGVVLEVVKDSNLTSQRWSKRTETRNLNSTGGVNLTPWGTATHWVGATVWTGITAYGFDPRGYSVEALSIA